MSQPILSASALSGLAELAQTAMQTEVTILRRSVTMRGTSLVSNDLGDDEIVLAETTESSRNVVKGSLSSTPTPVQVEDAGQLVTVNTYKLALPRGTDIAPGDEVRIGSVAYVVSDTTTESTWQALVLASLRKAD